MERKKLSINHILLIFIGFAVIAQIFILNRHSTMGDELTSINNKIDEITQENNRIAQKIASLSAMTVIVEKAKDYGLVSSSQILSLATSIPIASNLKLSL